MRRLLLIAVSPLVACAGGESGEAPVAAPTTFACPALDGADLSAQFGIPRDLAARVERMIRVATELERTAADFDKRTREACYAVARDLDTSAAMPAGHPCDVVKTRLLSMKAGGKLSVSVNGVSCRVTREALANCAGECLTGKSGVTSAVSCGDDSAAVCSGRLGFPNASASCAAECSARALRLSACTADIDVKAEGGNIDVFGLKRDLPELAGVATDIAESAKRLAADTKTLLEDLGAAIDDISHGSVDRSAVTTAVLAGCFAPRFAGAVRASGSLESTATAALSVSEILRR